MEGIVGGRSSVTSVYPRSSSATAVADLFFDLQRESAEQILFALAALEYYEQALLYALQHRFHSNQEVDERRRMSATAQYPSLRPE